MSLQDHVTNKDILEQCSTFSGEAQLKSRLSWLGHLHRMDDSRLPKKLKLSRVKGPRPPGCPRIIWHDVLKDDLVVVSVSRPAVVIRCTELINSRRKGNNIIPKMLIVINT